MDQLRGVAVAQTCPVRGDVEANLREHLALIERAAERGAELLVFPEMSLTGYELDLAPELAFTLTDPRLDPLKEAARAHRMTIVAGGPLCGAERPFIGAWVLAPTGTPRVYRKRHLGAISPDAHPEGAVPPPEPSIFAAGSEPLSLPCSQGLAWVAICADTGRASHAAEASDAGANVYLASMFVLPSGYRRERARLVEVADAHRMFVAMANFGGPSGGLPSAGRSCLISPGGKVFAEAPPTGSAVVVQDPSV